MAFLKSKFCTCSTSRSNSGEDIGNLKDLLPVSFDYNICNIEATEDGLIARFRININNKEAALKWLEEFTYSSNTSFRTDKVYPQNTVGNVYKVSKYCQHRSRDTKELKPTSKNTNCSARLVITVKKWRNQKSKDIHLQDFPTIVVLRHTHNHSLNSASALKYHKPHNDVYETYMKMFKAGMTPAKAYHRFSEELQESHGDDFYMVSADRSLNPDITWVYNTYYKLYRNEYGHSSGESMMASLDAFIKKYNQDEGGTFIKSEVLPDGNYRIVAVTPLMKRIMCNIPQSEEVLFCDATSCVDRFGTKTFQILTNSCCGGLPVAVLLTSSEDEEAFVSCLQMFKESIENSAFGGRGKKGPKVILTDDDQVEHNGFAKVFPDSEQLLCTFHILQCCWRYLCSSKSGVLLTDRQEIFFLIKKLLYAETEEEYLSIFSILISLETTKENDSLLRYLHKLDQRKHMWALYLRQGKILRGQNTNNISEAAVRVLKDRILERTKAYSLVQLLDFLVTDMNNFYARKMVSIANGRIPQYLATKYTFEEKKLYHLKVTEISLNNYQVSNEKSGMVYYVNLDMDLCTCFIGRNGQICKHLKKVSIVSKKDLRLCPPKNEADKKNLLFTALGEVNVTDEWFGPLLEPSVQKQENETLAPLEAENSETPVQLMTENNEMPMLQMPQHNLQIEENTDYRNTPEVYNTIQEFNTISNEIVELVKTDKELFKSFKKFVKNYRNIKTKAALQSAFTTFGKYSGYGLAKKMKLCSSKKIGVQPTAVARRKTKFGGRQAIQSGRPPKKARIAEHAYAQSNSQKSTLLPNKKSKSKAPHSILVCTEKNISLGKKH